MNYDLKIYDVLGFNARHIDTIDKVYGSVIDDNFNLDKQPKRVKDIIRHLAQLPGNLRPKFVFDASVSDSARKLKAFANRILPSKIQKNLKHN